MLQIQHRILHVFLIRALKAVNIILLRIIRREAAVLLSQH